MGYLFSQSEINEQIIKVDTVIKIDTMAITKTEESDFFYRHGVFRNPDRKWSETRAPFIISAKVGLGPFVTSYTASLDIPINHETGITAKYGDIRTYDIGGGGDATSFFALGVGTIYKRTDNYISKLNFYVGSQTRPASHYTYKYGICMGGGWDWFFGFKPFYISIGFEFIGGGKHGTFIGVPLGVHIAY